MGTGATRIFVTWRATGFHRWPAASGERDYLAARHRHVFHYRAELDVTHNDRDIEFHDLLDACHDVASEGVEWADRSCEAIGRVLLNDIEHRWPGRNPVVTVSEDGECGATVT